MKFCKYLDISPFGYLVKCKFLALDLVLGSRHPRSIKSICLISWINEEYIFATEFSRLLIYRSYLKWKYKNPSWILAWLFWSFFKFKFYIIYYNKCYFVFGLKYTTISLDHGGLCWFFGKRFQTFWEMSLTGLN